MKTEFYPTSILKFLIPHDRGWTLNINLSPICEGERAFDLLNEAIDFLNYADIEKNHGYFIKYTQEIAKLPDIYKMIFTLAICEINFINKKLGTNQVFIDFVINHHQLVLERGRLDETKNLEILEEIIKVFKSKGKYFSKMKICTE